MPGHKVRQVLREQPPAEWMPAEKAQEVEAEYGEEAFKHLARLAEELTAGAEGQRRADLLHEVAVLHELHVFLPGVRMLPEKEAAEHRPEDEPLQEELPSSLPSEAHARTTDPGTSHAAAKSIDPDRLRETQEAVLACFREFNAMHHELLVETYESVYRDRGWPKQSVSGLRTRTSELCSAGLLRASGGTVTLQSGRQSIVWEVVRPEG
jgi:hypothetical protein